MDFSIPDAELTWIGTFRYAVAFTGLAVELKCLTISAKLSKVSGQRFRFFDYTMKETVRSYRKEPAVFLLSLSCYLVFHRTSHRTWTPPWYPYALLIILDSCMCPSICFYAELG